MRMIAIPVDPMVNKNNLIAKTVAWPSKTATKRTDMRQWPRSM